MRAKWLLSYKPHKKRYDGAYHDHGGDRDIELKTRPVYDDIARQPTNGQFDEPGPEQTCCQKSQAQPDEELLHLYFPETAYRAV